MTSIGIWASLLTQMVKNLHAMQPDPGLSPGLERYPGEEIDYHCSVLAFRIPWTEEPGRL